MTTATTERSITDHEAAQVERANASTATPVVFVHGLWSLPSSWDRWTSKMPGRGHALTIDAGWREVAVKALEFVKRFV